MKLPRTFQLAMRYATRNTPEARKIQKRRMFGRRRPMAWPAGSLHARQTQILRWLESLGHKVDYR